MKFLLTTLISFVITASSYAQYNSWGSDPVNTKWYSIKTDHFTIIYAQDYDSIAQRLGNILEYSYDKIQSSIGGKPKHTSVVLHSQSVISNGSAAYAPKRIDMFDVVYQNNTPQDWYEHLAIHEYRHILQYEKTFKGLSYVLYALFGQQGVAAAANLFIPNWLFEGDAVATETALGFNGRGETAEFSMRLRAQVREKKIYRYAKAYFGSYRDFVPNYYEMGYFFMANVRDKYTNRPWRSVLKKIPTLFIFMPINRGLRTETGKNKNRLFKNIFKEQKIHWDLQYEREIQKPFDTLTKRTPRNYTNYISPVRISDSTIAVVRRSMSDISQIVIINDKTKNEKVIANVPFRDPTDRISTDGTHIVWSEIKQHYRWELAGTMNIKLYNISTKKTRTIQTKSRVFAPYISANGMYIVASELDKKGNYFIVIYNTETGELLNKIAAIPGETVISPALNENGTAIVYIGVSPKGKRLVELDIQTQTRKELIPSGKEDLMFPIFYKNNVIYSSSYSGIDNLYAIDRETQKTNRITVSGFGCKYPSVHKSLLLFSDYTSDGYMVGQREVKEESWHVKEVVQKYTYSLAQSLSTEEQGKIDFSKLPQTKYESKRYYKLLHTINVHSWIPRINATQISESEGRFNFGGELISENKLGNLVSRFGYGNFGENFDYNAGYANIEYSGWYPIITASVQHGNYNKRNFETNSHSLFKLTNNSFGITLPYSFSSRGYNRNVSLLTSYNYIHQKLVESTSPLETPLEEETVILTSFRFLNLRSQAIRDIFPRWGQEIEFGYLHQMQEPNYTFQSNTVYAIGNFYFPGIYKNHSTTLQLSYSETSKNSLWFEHYTKTPYAYTLPSTTSGVRLAQINYALPLFYPDFGGSIAYLKRIYIQGFASYAAMRNLNVWNEEILTYGGEFVSEWNFLHQYTPIELGFILGNTNDTNFVSLILRAKL